VGRGVGSVMMNKWYNESFKIISMNSRYRNNGCLGEASDPCSEIAQLESTLRCLRFLQKNIISLTS
jgi:hypothetical protein